MISFLDAYAFQKPPPIIILFDELRKLLSFKYLNADFLLSQYDPNLSLRTLFLSEKERFVVGKEASGSSDILVTTISLSVLAIVSFGLFLSILACTKKGRATAVDEIKKKKNAMFWNGIIMMTYANY